MLLFKAAAQQMLSDNITEIREKNLSLKTESVVEAFIHLSTGTKMCIIGHVGTFAGKHDHHSVQRAGNSGGDKHHLTS